MRNIGTADRIIRVIAGLSILALVVFGPKTPWAWLGLVPLITAVTGWCPAYTVLRVRTRSVQAGEKPAFPTRHLFS